MDHPVPDLRAGVVHAPARDLALSTFLSRWHDAAPHHLSASECETMRVDDLLALAEPDDAARWRSLSLGYTDPIGPPWLRAAIADGYDLAGTDDLMCFAGAEEALYATLHTLLSPEDHAIVVVPSYQSMETLPLGLCAVSAVALDPARGWSLDPDEVAAAIRPTTRLLIISFPNNPTGKLLERDRFDALVGLCRARGIWLLSDEVYRLTEYDPAMRLPPVADVYERGISLGSMSKAYGLPGLRVAWAACRDPALVAALARIRQYLSTCNAGPSEVLARIALRAAPILLARNRAITASNLAALAGVLHRLRPLVDWVRPQAGMVCYPAYHGADGVEQFVTRIACTAGVLLLPASVFRSELTALPPDRFRIGFGRGRFPEGLAALERAMAPSGSGQ